MRKGHIAIFQASQLLSNDVFLLTILCEVCSQHYYLDNSIIRTQAYIYVRMYTYVHVCKQVHMCTYIPAYLLNVCCSFFVH